MSRKSKKVNTIKNFNFEFLAHFDGACEPYNPGGNMGIGAIVYECNGTERKPIHEHSSYIPASKSNSNNVAEYMGLIEVLTFLNDNSLNDRPILVRGDSNLVIQQMNGLWRIRFGYYVPYAMEAQEMLATFTNIKLE